MHYDTGKHCGYYHRYHLSWSTTYRNKVLRGASGCACAYVCVDPAEIGRERPDAAYERAIIDAGTARVAATLAQLQANDPVERGGL